MCKNIVPIKLIRITEKSIITDYSQRTPLSIFINFRYNLLIFIDFYQILLILSIEHVGIIGLFHFISTPPRLRTDLSLLPLKNSIKKCYPLKTSLRIGFAPEEFHKKALTPEEFHEISVYPWRIPRIIWVLPPKNSPASGLYP